MIVYKNLKEIKDMPETCVALGYFDGIHAGHQALIERCVADAKERGVRSCVFTFSNSPKEAIRSFLRSAAGENGTKGSGRHGGAETDPASDRSVPDNAPQALMTWDEKVRALAGLGVDYLVAPAFGPEIMNMSPEAFVGTLLIGTCRMVGAYCGFNYTFGRRAAGRAEVLLRMGQEGVAVPADAAECETACCPGPEAKRTFTTFIQPPFRIDGQIVSSTLVRECVARGDLSRANRFLGHVFSLEGVTVPGRRIGTSIGFPTANFLPDPMLLLPPDGVYATKAELDGAVYPGVTNIGRNPTVSGADERGFADGSYIARRVETHLFDPPSAPDGSGPAELYGRPIRVFFYEYLRREVKFADETELRRQIARDKETARAYWSEQKA